MPPDLEKTKGEKVALRQGSVAIALREGVEHPYIEKCALPISPPETLSHNVQPCTVFSIRCPVCKLLFGHLLQVGFSANTMTYLTQEVSGHVADLIMADRWKSSSGAVQSTCSTVNCIPQMQWEGKCVGRQPYRRHSASLKVPLWRANPCSARWKANSRHPSLQNRSRPSRGCWEACP